MTVVTTTPSDDSNSSSSSESSDNELQTTVDSISKPGNSKRGRKPKYLHTIILEGINARELYKRLKIGKPANDAFQTSGIMEYVDNNCMITTESGANAAVTNLPEFSSNRRNTNLFLDSKTTSKLTTFVDYIKYGSLPYKTDLSCWHDRHPFSTSPIGCPVRYVEKMVDKHTPTSAVAIMPTPHSGSNDTPVSDSVKKTLPKISTNNYYLTMGVFCSFPCVLAFINANRHNPLYKDSKVLLHSLYYKLYGSELKISPANDWQCLKNYGGHLSIEEFRRSFCTCNYVITPDIKRPFMVSVGKHIEEHQCGYL